MKAEKALAIQARVFPWEREGRVGLDVSNSASPDVLAVTQPGARKRAGARDATTVSVRATNPGPRDPSAFIHRRSWWVAIPVLCPQTEMRLTICNVVRLST